MEKTGIFKSMRNLSDLGRERTGVAAVEFALVIPFIIVLLLASVDAVFALTAKRKVSIATHSIADLSTRERNLADDDLSAIADLGRLILTPFNAAESRIAITGAEVLPSGNQAVVRWSQLFDQPNGGAAGSGSTVTDFPDGHVIDLKVTLSEGTFLVMSAVEMPYSTLFQFLEARFNGGQLFNLNDEAYAQSRSGTEITNLSP